MIYQEWLTVDEAAEYLRVAKRTIYKLCKDAYLAAYRTGNRGHLRFRKEDLDRAMKRVASEGEPGDYATSPSPLLEAETIFSRHILSGDPDYELFLLILRTGRAIIMAREKEVSPYGVTSVQAGVLFFVQLLGQRATPTEIARWMFRKPHTTSKILSSLEEKGLIRKVRDPDKKNVVRVALTENGKQAYHHSAKRISIHSVMSQLPEDVRQRLRSNLEVLLNRAFKDLGMESRLPYPRSLASNQPAGIE